MNFSSVILGEASGGDPPRPDPSADATALGTSSTTTSNDDEALPSRFGFLDVLDILRQYAVPSVDLRYPVGTTNENEVQDASATTSTLEQSANRAPTAFSHVLGGGYSAVVLRHATKEDVFAVTTEGDVIARQTPKLVAKSGTLVAFKKISPRPSENGINDTFRQSEAFRTICQEITVYRHPLLQRHENIGKLLYVAWQRLEVFPWIALELAAFGTLEDVLTAPGEGPTYQQKWNLTIDVALGVAAMHHVGIVHGDLKSANILVHHHPDRQIVGQVADFGGGVTVGQGTPIIGTPLWCAPEVLLAAPEIDRKLADTWSYGLIVASIWSHLPHPERAESSCFLDRLVSKHLEGGAREARTLLIKTEPDSSPNSLVSSCLGLSSCIVPLLLATLSCDCAQRTSIEALVDQDLAALCPEMIRK
jgi:serine/threonine protein kinase